ncbi:PREDICTED: uncharacterized protein LOC104758557 [Camelina sativa]|uniref:Uncharacterized protein LOC104758557 n=1 Tax=Camelina sativa TaxID=90675 RepID=A0ABM0X2S0_CAMSA|nr:PREDICTED: uncharacterized protein LOC104758557 [Camelina sativa]
MVMDREERRRKIMERGSDRLALITGQIHNFDPSSPSSSSSSSASHNRTYSESSFMPQTQSAHHLMQESPSLKYHFKEEVRERSEEPKLSSSVLSKPLKSEPIAKPEEATRSVKSQNKRPRSFFSSKKLNASIISSERTRSLSSLAIAAFVILLPRLNIISSGSVLTLRPLWLLILTDCAIVMSHLTVEASGEGLGHEMEDEGKGKDGENWSDAEKLLERGVVVYQALRGMFIDCSLYMVIVICGDSLL